jgi:hypothetical protein
MYCIACRINLSALSAVKNVNCVDDIDSYVKQLYKFDHSSPLIMNQVRKVTEILEQQVLKFQYLHDVRWFASKVGALTALVMDWKSVIVHLGNIVATEKGNITAVAKGLLKKMKDFKFLYMIYFIVDYLCILKSLSLLFQKQDILISTVELHVENAVAALTSFKKVPSLHDEKCLSNTWM